MISTNKLIAAIVIIHLIANLVASAALISMQLDAIKARKEATSQRMDLKKQNDFLVCILQIQPAQRTSEVISDCRSKTLGVK